MESGKYELHINLKPALDDAELDARILSDFVAENELAGWELSAEATGEVLFEPLEEGMYLVCSLSPQMEFMPFLVRIPMKIYGNTVYHVLAEPKKDPTPDTPTPPSPTTNAMR